MITHAEATPSCCARRRRGAAVTLEDALESLVWRGRLWSRYARHGPRLRRRLLLQQASLRIDQSLTGAAQSGLYERLRRRHVRPESVAHALLVGVAALMPTQPLGERLALAEAAWLVLDGGAADLVAGATDGSLAAALAAWVAALQGGTVHLVCADSAHVHALHERGASLWPTLGRRFALALRPAELPVLMGEGAVVLTLAAALGYAQLFSQIRQRRSLRVGDAVAALLGVDGDSTRAPETSWCIVADADLVLLDLARQAAVLDNTVLAPPAQVEAGLRIAERLGDAAFEGSGPELGLTLAGERMLRVHWPGEARDEAALWACLGRLAGSGLHAGIDYDLSDGVVRLADSAPVRTLGPRERIIVEAMLARRHGLEAPPREAVARVTVQRLLRRYRRLGAAGNGLATASTELWATYGLVTRRLAPWRETPKTVRVAPDTAVWLAWFVDAVAAGLAGGACVWAWVPPAARDDVVRALVAAQVPVCADGDGCCLLESLDVPPAVAQVPPAALLVAGVPGRRRLLRLERAAGRAAEVILDWSAVSGSAASPLTRAVLSVPGTARHRWLSRWVLDAALWRMEKRDGAVRAAMLGAEDRALANLAFAGGDQEGG